MVFSSIVFISFFLPATFLLHLILPGFKAKNWLLVAASLLFYAYGEPVYVFLMIGSAFVNYAAARLIGERKNRIVLAAAVILNIGLLVVFKYAAFLVSLVNTIPGIKLPVPQIALPIGISFFTFQALSYVIDVYRGVNKAQKSFPKVLLYISFFPQLIAGPIVKYHDIEKEIDDRHASSQDLHDGLRRFAAGLCKKVLIANTMAVAADAVFGAGRAQIGSLSAWLGALAYLFQIYFDFSGYSDMAIGMGRMFGFHFLENFDHPYIAGSIRDFWRRWHISLTGWFREYLYIPLGGNRKGRTRTIVNRIIVFICTGIWHGANLTFLLWGLYHGFLMLLEEALPRVFSGGRIKRALLHLYTLIAVTVGFVMFRADTVGEGFFRIGRMFSGIDRNASSISLACTQLTPLFLTAFAAAVICSFPVPERVRRLRGYETAADLLSAAGLVLCLLSLAGGAYNPFIYFRF